ncbi:MAG: hypothetical protein N6V49_07660, partial [Serratia symbiotica]|nr:hypothetical protein [Serratia symbiotica]
STIDMWRGRKHSIMLLRDVEYLVERKSGFLVGSHYKRKGFGLAFGKAGVFSMLQVSDAFLIYW